MARISVNKLAELLISPSAARRRRIVTDQKHPPDIQVARYRLARPVVRDYFTAIDRQASIIDAAVVRLRADNSGTPWNLEDRQSTADALEHLIQLLPKLPQDEDLRFSFGADDAPKLTVAGVEVSVRPDIIVTRFRRGRASCGAFKFHWVKNDDSSLQKRGSEFVAVVMHEWLRQFGPGNHQPDPKLCLSIDVFRRSVVHSPQAMTRRLEEIEAGCQEVAARWGQV